MKSFSLDVGKFICLVAGAILLMGGQDFAHATTASIVAPVSPSVVLYPGPPGISPSPQYVVNVTSCTQSSKGCVLSSTSGSSFVYQTQNPGFLNGKQTTNLSSSIVEQATAWTGFSFNGAVKVSITNAKPFTSARILPSSKQIPVSVSGQTVSFIISAPGQYAIDFCTQGTLCTESNVDLTNPLLIFANPLETNPPTQSSANTIYFAPGVYDLGTTPYVIQTNQTVYIAGGAYVKGFFEIASGASNWAIRGRGIISGEDVQNLQAGDCAGRCTPLIFGLNESLGTIEGVTLIEAPLFNIALGGYYAKFPIDNAATQNTINNVKILSWHGTSDGIAAGYGSADPGSTIQNSFLKVGDSGIHLNSSNLSVSNCTIWQMDASAPFEISDTMGGNLNIDIQNVKVQDIDVVRSEHYNDRMEAAIFSAHHGGRGILHNYLFNNIRIENSSYRLFSLAVRPSPWSLHNTQLAAIYNLRFKNITVSDPQQMADLFQSYDYQHQLADITFNNVTVAGKSLGSAPQITLNANRTASLGGNIVYDPLWRQKWVAGTQNAANFQIWNFNPVTAPVPQYTSFAVNQTEVTEYHEQAVGNFNGNDYAGILFSNSVGDLGILKNPILEQWPEPYQRIGYALQSDEQVVGTGDFNGDGFSDILIWSKTAQSGKILFMQDLKIIGSVLVQPSTSPAQWESVWIGDLDQNGYSDILLRDQSGNIEILSYGLGDAPVKTDIKPAELGYRSTSFYTQNYGALSGVYDTNWTIVGVADIRGLGNAGIVWYKPDTGDFGTTYFAPNFQNLSSGRVQFGYVFARFHPGDILHVVVPGDLDGNGTADIWINDAHAVENGIIYTNLWLPNLYELGSARMANDPEWFLQK